MSFRSMRLALIVPTLRAGGAERVVVRLANHWAKAGHTVFLVILTSPDEAPFYAVDPGVTMIALDRPLLQRIDSPQKLWDLVGTIVHLRRALGALKLDVGLSFLTTMNLMSLVAFRFLGVPLIISERIDPAFHKIPFLYEKLRQAMYPWAHQLIVQTTAVQQYFPEFLQRKITVIPNSVGVATERHRVRPDGTVQKIATVGRLAPQKDHPTLIRAFSTIAARFPDLVLTLYGDGPDREHLTQLIHALGMQDRIHLPGVISNIDQALAESDLFVFPSRYEGFPNALCEAMAVGLPVIASNCSGNVDVVQEGIDGRLFPVGDEATLAERMAELITDAAQRERLAKGALEITKRFQKSKILKAWDQVMGLGGAQE